MVTRMTEVHDGQPEPGPAPELFIEFANTLAFDGGGATDRIEQSAALVDWISTHGLIDGRPSAARVRRELDAFRELRELVREVVERRAEGRAPTATQVQRLNRVLRDGLHYHQLRAEADGARFTVGQVGDELAQARAAIAGSLAHFLAEHDPDRLRVCANDGCRWLFVDRSPAGRKRWCDMRTCGNRAKVARHRARRRVARA